MGDNRTECIVRNQKEYGDIYSGLAFVSETEAEKASGLRNELLAGMGDRILFMHKHTKPVTGAISRGCQTCGKGTWSCIFINGKCNCRCFYCPTKQTSTGVPTTNTIQFPRSADYVDYLEKLKFEGVGISGGEPLMTLNTTLKFISAVKRKFGEKIYLWMYTNGVLATRENLLQLKDAGVDEIRFDIGASDYDLTKAKMAAGIIDHVTVEIPAIPEDYNQMRQKLIEMETAGISYLNLHQLRLTPHNYNNLKSRSYTYLHGEHVTVLESELTALKLMAFAADRHIRVPVNYCSFVYKNRFQRSAARKRSAVYVKKSYEDITENGYIRSLCLSGEPEAVAEQAENLSHKGIPSDLWCVKNKPDLLYFSAAIWKEIQFSKFRLSVMYYEAKILSAITYQHFFTEVRLNRDKKIFIEKIPVSEKIEMDMSDAAVFESRIIRSTEDLPSEKGRQWSRIESFELIEEGLQVYY